MIWSKSPPHRGTFLCDSGDLTDTNLPGECPRRDLNPRPLPYQGSALPLSYKGNIKVGRVGFEPT